MYISYTISINKSISYIHKAEANGYFLRGFERFQWVIALKIMDVMAKQWQYPELSWAFYTHTTSCRKQANYHSAISVSVLQLFQQSCIFWQHHSNSSRPHPPATQGHAWLAALLKKSLRVIQWLENLWQVKWMHRSKYKSTLVHHRRSKTHQFGGTGTLPVPLIISKSHWRNLLCTARDSSYISSGFRPSSRLSTACKEPEQETNGRSDWSHLTSWLLKYLNHP